METWTFLNEFHRVFIDSMTFSSVTHLIISLVIRYPNLSGHHIHIHHRHHYHHPILHIRTHLRNVGPCYRATFNFLTIDLSQIWVKETYWYFFHFFLPFSFSFLLPFL